MANKNTTTNQMLSRSKNKINKNMNNINGLLDDVSTSLYGTDRTSELDDLQHKFNNIMKNELKTLTNSGDGDITSFLNKLYSKNKDEEAFNRAIDKDFLSLNMDGVDSTVAAYISDAYRNRLVKQADIHEVSSQLIELREAICVMRDAIISPDINTGRINRELKFGDKQKGINESYTDTIEAMEEKFDLQKKIKDFIVYNALEQGEYYVYTIPYSVLFNDFMKKKDRYSTTRLYTYGESAESKKDIEKIKNAISLNNDSAEFIESCYDDYIKSAEENLDKMNLGSKKALKESFSNDMENILDRISIVTDPIPLPVLEEGLDSMEKYRCDFVSESGEYFCERKNGEKLVTTPNQFKNRMKSGEITDGAFFSSDNNDKSTKNQFKDIKDCYVKMVSPTQLIPITMMDEEIGYFYLKVSDASPLGGLVSASLKQQKFDENRRERDIVGDISARIVSKFDKSFLKENPKFKKLIVEAINYYDLNENRIQFQYVPKEYIFPFKINVDEENHGVSMLDGSLFYAKLYLMLLLFKMMTIICNSNDQKVNYIRQSGISKDLSNKVQDIARQKQARKINMMDLFSYTTLINKVGNGTEMYIPTGRNGERPVETEILSGQDVQINSELMELLRNSYILGTGVPSAIMNYLNEADFAKSIETANSKFNGRVINYQLDFNPSLTKWYRQMAKWSTNIPEDVIDEMTISLPTPKFAKNTVTQDMIGNFTSTSDFLVALYFGESSGDPAMADEVLSFKKKLARKFLSILNFDELDELFINNKKESKEETLKPKPKLDTENELDNF